jgi:uncharacterized membrane protein YjjP (DUF1212 family)
MSIADEGYSLEFVARLGSALATYGAPAHRLEQVLEILTVDLYVAATISSTPTLLLMDFALPDGNRMRMERIRSNEIDLGRLCLLDELFNEVADHRCTPREGLDRLDQILDQPDPYGPLATCAAFAFTSGAAALLFGGGALEVQLGVVAGAILGLVSVAADYFDGVARIFEPLGAFMVALFIGCAAPWVGPVDVDAVLLAGVIVLVLGFTLTIGVSELVTHHTSSGVARLGRAAVTALLLAFGAALGSHLAELAVGVSVAQLSDTILPFWAAWLAFPVAVVTISVLFRAPLRDWWGVLLVSLLGFVTLEALDGVLRFELGVFLAALAVGCGSNLYARWMDRPSAVTRLPALLFLVPGSLGFVSMSGLLRGDVGVATETAGLVGLVVMSLVTGLVLAGSVIPPRKVL